MVIDAIVLAGGRATRLGGASKAGLSVGGRSLLERTIVAVSSTRHIVVVGDESDITAAAPDVALTIAREVPAFGGPAAGIAAGFDALDGESDFVVIVGCDMPAVSDAIGVLLGAVVAGSDGVVAVSSDGRPQPLVAVYPAPALAQHRSPPRRGQPREPVRARAAVRSRSCASARARGVDR